MIPAMKRVVAEFSGHRGWKTVRPPLCDLDGNTTKSVLSALREAQFSMPAYPRS